MRLRSDTPSRWAHTTPLLWYCTAIYMMGDVLFGLDTGSFGSLQALPGFLRQFGELEDGKYVLSTGRKSIMNSVVWTGKAAGIIAAEPVIEKIGYKWTMYVVCAFQCLGIIIELSSKTWPVFTVGRIVAYISVGLVENAVPAYTSEVTPASIRGFFSGTLMFFLLFGNLWGAGMGRAYALDESRRGWMVPVGVQFIPAIVIAIGLPFTPESPRWLISKGKKERALKELDRIRPLAEVDSGMTVAEVDVLEQAIEESKRQNQGSWIDLFRGTYLRRTMIACWMYIFQEWTGGQFIISYGPTFYTLFGLGSKAFTYTVLTNAIAIVACGCGLLIYDKIGRRPVLIVGAVVQTLTMLLIGGLGTKSNKSQADINGVVASFIIFYSAYKISISTLAFVNGAEIGGVRMRKKTNAFALLIDVTAAFVVTFSIPYLLTTQGANLGAKVGWIFAGISGACLVFCAFFVPELKGRSLEETDELFEMRLWAWQFSKAETRGLGRRIAQLEQADKGGAMELGEVNTSPARDVEDVK